MLRGSSFPTNHLLPSFPSCNMVFSKPVQFYPLLFLFLVAVFGSYYTHAGSVTERTVVFGVSLTLTTDQYTYTTPYQYQALYGFEIWIDWWNKLDPSLRTITNKTTGEETLISIALFYIDDHADPYTGGPNITNAYARLSSNSSIDFLFAPIGKPESMEVFEAARNVGRVVMMGTTDSSEAWYIIPGAYGSAPSSAHYSDSVLPYWRLNGVKTVGIIVDTDLFQTEICQGFAASAPTYGIAVTGIFQNSANAYAPPDLTNLTGAYQQMKATNPDAILICDYNPGVEFYMALFRNDSYSPKSIALSNLFATPAVPEDFEFVITFADASPLSNYPPQTNFGDMKSYSNMYYNVYGNQPYSGGYPTTSTVQATLGGMLYTNAIMAAQSIDQNDVLNALKTEIFDSFAGLAYFDTHHNQLLANMVLMQVNLTWRVVGPALATEFNFIYPFPPWNSRVYHQVWGNWADITGLVILSCGCLVSFIFLVGLITYIRSEVVKLASRPFLFIAIFGSLLANAGVAPWMPNLVNTATCQLRVWLLPCGAMLLVSFTTAKQWAVLRLYWNSRKKITFDSKLVACGCPVGNGIIPRTFSPQLIFFAIMLFIPQIIFCVLMSSQQPFGPIYVEINPYDTTNNYMLCSFSGATLTIAIINFAYALLVALWGIYLAWKIRAIKTKIYDEGKVLAFAFYNMVFFTLVAIVIRLALPSGNNRFVPFVILAACTFIGTGVSLTFLFIGRFIAIRLFDSSSSSLNSSPPNTSSFLSTDVPISSHLSSQNTSSSGVSRSQKDVGQLEAVFAANKTRIAQLEERLALLKAKHGYAEGEEDEEDSEAKEPKKRANGTYPKRKPSTSEEEDEEESEVGEENGVKEDEKEEASEESEEQEP